MIDENRRIADKERWEIVFEHFAEISKTVNEVKTTLLVHIQNNNETKDKVNKLCEDINGNGHEGLKSEMQTIKIVVGWIWKGLIAMGSFAIGLIITFRDDIGKLIQLLMGIK